MKRGAFGVLCATGLFAIFSSTISKSPVLPLYMTYLGAGPSAVGLVASVSALTGVLFSLPAGVLSDRVGRRRMLILSSVVFATAPLLYLLVTKPYQFALVRLYHGLATAIFIPVATALVSELFHAERGEKISYFSTMTLAGRFMAPIVGGAIIASAWFAPGVNFKAVYVVCGAAGAATLVLALRIPATVRAVGHDRDRAEWLLSLKALLSNRGILLTSIVEAAILFAYGTFETFLPLRAIEAGLTPFHAGAMISAQVVTLALTKPVMGRFSDRHGRRPQIFLGAVVGAASVFCLSRFGSFFPLILSSVLFGLSLSVVTSATSAYIADLSPVASRGAAMGVLGSVMDIGHTTGPIVSGLIAARFGYSYAFAGAAFLLVVIGLVFKVGISSVGEAPKLGRA